MKSTIKLFSVAVIVGIIAVVLVSYRGEQPEESLPTSVAPETVTESITSTTLPADTAPVIEATSTTEVVDLPIDYQPTSLSPTSASTSVPSQTETISSTNKIDSANSVILLNVPFLSQAPFREWKDPRQQDGCEEASVIMVMEWVKGNTNITKADGKEKILAISHYTEDTYGEFRDTSVNDTLAWLIRGYYEYAGEAEIVDQVTADDIKKELMAGNPVILPTNGQLLNNPYFTPPGPVIHMLVVIGYDPLTEEFITNDPGIGRGSGYRYPVDTIVDAIRDYATGYHNPTDPAEKRMIVVRK